MISVTVIGSGAIGKFYGGLFVLAGCEVCYLERSDFITIQDKKHYELELPDNSVVQIVPNKIVRAIMHEVCLVARKDGAEMEDNIEKLIALTATFPKFYPSMYYDFQMNNPIESQYIILNVIEYAQSHQLSLPVLSLIYEKLTLLEKKQEMSTDLDRQNKAIMTSCTICDNNNYHK